MAIFKCNVCGYLYDEAGNTLFSALPNDWRCPICGSPLPAEANSATRDTH